MIKIQSILFYILLAFSGSLVSQTTTYGFETGTDGFTINASGTLTTIETSSSDTAYEGSKSLKIEVTSTGTGNLQAIKRTDVAPGDIISYKFYLKSNQNRTVNIKSQYTGALGYGGTELLQSDVAISATGWTEITAQITVPMECPLASGGTPINVFVSFLEQGIDDELGLIFYLDAYAITNEIINVAGGEDNETTGGGDGSGTIVYVAPDGDDNNNGTLQAPFKTIATALSNTSANGIVRLRAGVYDQETILNTNASNSPLTIEAYMNEQPLISGVDTLSVWTLDSGNIYYASVAKEVTQVFVGTEQMQVARWPNLTSNNLLSQEYASASNVDYLGSGVSSMVTDTNLTDISTIDIIGAKVWLPYPFLTKWNSLTETVTVQTANSISFIATENFVENEDDVDYHLTGKLGLLDAEKEWFYDSTTDRLYFYAPNGVDPSTLNVLARTRINGIEINGNDIAMKGIDFFAATIDIFGNNNLVEECNVEYPRPFYNTERWKEQAGVSIKGKFNTIRKCEVSNSWGSGISMLKLNANNLNEDSHIENCLVHDVNWTGSIAPGISIDGYRLTATGNTVYNCGRSGIRQYRIYNSLVEKNHVYNYGLINTDLGGIKGGLQDYEHSEWRYNYTHNGDAVGGHGAKAGIYLDASNDNALVHHNVMYNVHLSINGDVNNNKVFNNTLVADDSNQKVWSHFIRAGEDWDYRSVFTWNNLSTNEVLGTDLKKNLRKSNINNLGFVGVPYGDFRLIETSSAIDNGIDISGITDGAVNKPDSGAFEFGGSNINGNWVPGINWSPKWNQPPTGGIDVVTEGSLTENYVFQVINDNDIEGWIMRYDWGFGDGTTSYGKTVNHRYQADGNYSVTLTLKDNLGGVTVISKNISIDTLSVEDNALEIAKIYPNPATSYVTVKSLSELQNIRIIDLYGRTWTVIKDLKRKTKTIDISELSVGVYLIQTLDTNNKKGFYKFIKD